MQKHKLKYVDEMVCFQEVPDETTLSFSISNCPHRCPGCHSSYLAEDVGIPLLDVLGEKLDFHKGLITCVLFMGGDDEAQRDELMQCVKLCKEYGLKTALYSGAIALPASLWDIFDYVKVGPYKEELGGLDKPTTNQRMYRHEPDSSWSDITSKFWKKGLKVGKYDSAS